MIPIYYLTVYSKIVGTLHVTAKTVMGAKTLFFSENVQGFRGDGRRETSSCDDPNCGPQSGVKRSARVGFYCFRRSAIKTQMKSDTETIDMKLTLTQVWRFTCRSGALISRWRRHSRFSCRWKRQRVSDYTRAERTGDIFLVIARKLKLFSKVTLQQHASISSSIFHG